ncbi:MAG: hypothetical protein ABI162_06420 [Luteolibacter sp.]
MLTVRRTLVLAGYLSVISAHAQSPGLIEQARQRSAMFDFGPEAQPPTEAEAAENIEGGALETPGDFDLGIQLIMKPKERAHPLRFFATVDEFYTDNVGLVKEDHESDSYLFSEIGVRYENKLTDAINLEATVRQAIFRYDKFGGLDFESMNAGVGLAYKVPELADITVFSRYNYERLTNDDFGNGFFMNQTLSFGAQKSWVYRQTSSFYAGYSSMFGFSKPVISERDEHSLFGGGHWNLAPQLEGDVYYRIALFDFQSGQRDLNQSITPSLTYHLSPRCELNASFSFVLNRSNRSRFDYDAITTGGGVSLKLQF